MGLAKDKTGEADHSDEIDCTVSEDSSEGSDELMSKAQESEVIQIGRGYTRAELLYFKNDFKKEQARFLKREEMNNHEFGFLWFVSLLFFAALLVVGHFVFDPEKCGINLYDNQGFCFDCLQTLGDKCELCSKFGECDKCIPGYYLGEVQIADSKQAGCINCQNLFDNCKNCNMTNCTECKPKYWLHQGKCFDCSDYPASLECGPNGAIRCEVGYYIEKKDGKNFCRKCSDDLEFCLECDNKDRCRKCSSDFFRIFDDGKCNCKGGKNSFFDYTKKECMCKASYYLTTEGCRKCDEAISECNKCEITD